MATRASPLLVGRRGRAVRTSLAVLAGAAVMAASARGLAQQEEDEAAARALFEEGRKLAASHDYERACAKFEAARKLYEGSGVLLNLADCYEHVGRTASAWTEFGEAAAAAERLGRPDDEAEAKRRKAALQAKLSRLVVRVPHATPGMVVERDGAVLDRAAWGEALPVDPGRHTVTARAPGHAPWWTTLDVAAPAETDSIDVPELRVDASTEPSAPEQRAAPAFWSGRRLLAAGLGAAGVVAAAVGGGLAWSAKSRFDQATGETGTTRANDAHAAVVTGNVATAFVIGGGALVAAGVVLWLTAPTGRVAVGYDGREVLCRALF